MALKRMFLFFGGSNGAIWLVISAWLVHGAANYSDKDVASLAIASAFAFIHSLLLLQVGFSLKEESSRVLNSSGILLIVGIFLFCFIILFKVVWPGSIIAALSSLTPIGGLALISAWLLIAIQGFYTK
ncbi:DUF423 domain-containing protein [Thalassotalea litorea]|uniref:DUF423 domain-containing protein n=1 Tax=Thalassotalea litorea TaxID=2020715 RepID=A0A5R9IPX8_9GAMM|nr:DUF423 domain-containing protein [Thalassotalea litorea]TLU67594.1 DUF423 domain-containing protein [Thalassotalea litorea]